MNASSLSILGAAVRDNVAALRQAAELLGGLDAERYARRSPACFNSSMGGHLRHVVEHYASFLQGLRTGMVDYEARPRDARIENDPGHAARCMAGLEAELTAWAEAAENRRLRVRSESASGEEAEPWGDSCALRELEFLLSHTIHHFALIGVICTLAGRELPPDFGVAPSTLRFRRAQAEAA